jgi:hypothetical protein
MSSEPEEIVEKLLWHADLWSKGDMPWHGFYCREAAAEIARLRDKIEQKSTDISVLGKRIEERDEIIETLRALLQEWMSRVLITSAPLPSSLFERSRRATEK